MWSAHHSAVVSQLIAASLKGQRIGTHSIRLDALHIGGSMWADYYLRPNGEVVIVGEDFDHPGIDTVKTESIDVLSVLVWGSQRYPELNALLPVRDDDAKNCPCQSVEIFRQRKVMCPNCLGLGWLPGGLPFRSFLE